LGYTNPDPSERALSSNEERMSHGKNEVEKKMAGIDLYEHSGRNRVGEIYQEEYEKKSSFTNSDSPVKAQSANIYQGNSVRSSPLYPELRDEKMSSSERTQTMACNFDKTKLSGEAMTSVEASYWNLSQKVKKNRFYVMPIIETADLKLLQTVNGLGARFAHEELFKREAQLPPNSIGKRYLFFTPDNELMTQIGNL